MSLPVKAGISLATIGTVGGVGYGIFAYSQDKGTEISKLVEAEYRYILLDIKDGNGNEDSAQWGTNWESYKKANENDDKDFFELEGWNKETKPDLKDKLRKKCEELSKSKIKSTDDKLFERVTTYCGRPVSIKDQAKRDQLKVIAKENDSAWTEVERKKSDLTVHFENLAIKASSGNNITKEDIKGGCEKIVNKNRTEDGYSKAYASYKVVCASE